MYYADGTELPFCGWQADVENVSNWLIVNRLKLNVSPVKQPRKRKLLKEDALKAVVSIYSYVAIFFILVAHHPE